MDLIRKQLGVTYPSVTAATLVTTPTKEGQRPTSPIGLKGHYRRRSVNRGDEGTGVDRPTSPLEFAPTKEPDTNVDLIGHHRRPLRSGAAAVTNPYHHMPTQLEHRSTTAQPEWLCGAEASASGGRPSTAKQKKLDKCVA